MPRFPALSSLPLARLLMATSGGYAVISLITVMLAAAFPFPASEAVIGSALIGLTLYPAFIIGSFMVKQLRHLLAGIVLIILSLGLVIVIWFRP